jgi:hypothetical protein
VARAVSVKVSASLVLPIPAGARGPRRFGEGVGKPGLADSGLTGKQNQGAAPGRRRPEGVHEHRQLAVAAEQQRRVAS